MRLAVVEAIDYPIRYVSEIHLLEVIDLCPSISFRKIFRIADQNMNGQVGVGVGVGADQINKADFGAVCPLCHVVHPVLIAGLFATGEAFHVKVFKPMKDSHNFLNRGIALKADTLERDIGLSDTSDFNHLLLS